jgi:hypothetical protein
MGPPFSGNLADTFPPSEGESSLTIPRFHIPLRIGFWLKVEEETTNHANDTNKGKDQEHSFPLIFAHLKEVFYYSTFYECVRFPWPKAMFTLA